ncbi:MAG TPA: sensor domain-containing diguanylate cyclase, partial [Candidatus Kapabacteria bacterium]|nr:sensor domain-containing diguanylate cyclase [Candidatus Kapabacteria bacterium]
MTHEKRNDFEPTGPKEELPKSERDDSLRNGEQKRMKKVTFDDFQITREGQQAQVDEERRAWQERQERLEKEKPSIIRFAVPRIKSLRDEMIGVQNKLPFFRKPHRGDDIAHGPEPIADALPADSSGPYFAEHERAGVRVTRAHHQDSREPAASSPMVPEPLFATDAEADAPFASRDLAEPEHDSVSAVAEATDFAGQWNGEIVDVFLPADRVIGEDEFDEENLDSELLEKEMLEDERSVEEILEDEIIQEVMIEAETLDSFSDDLEEFQDTPSIVQSMPEADIPLEPRIEPSLLAYLDALRSFDSHPRRATEARDPRADFVVLLGDILDILRDELSATSAMFFWVNAKKQQLVLESAALDDRAFQFLAADKRFPIELDAVSRIVSKRRPELHSTIAPQAELDLIPYYRDAIGISSFAGMPVLFGEGLVAVLTVDSSAPDHFSPETLRILTDYSKLLSGLIRSYIEKYDLLAAARTLDASRKLHEIVSPDSSLRALRDQRRNPDYILRAFTEAASEIIEWDWLAAASFDDSRRLWTISSLQSKRGSSYVSPMTPISLEESIVGKCLASGKSVRMDSLTPQSVRYNLEEDRQNAVGHSFLTIPIRTTTKNYGVLAIEHTERARFTSADVETLEHLARGAATALEIIALGEMVGARALTDLLTGVLNKHGLLERSNQELARAMQFDEPLTFVLFEIDGASEFTSRFSQEDSDTIVLAITRLLQFGARPFDVIARIEEHTFAALLIKMTDEDGYLWSEKMRKMIVSEVIAIGKRSYSVTVSIGVSGARREGTVEELIEGSELALERARELGGNNVIV